MPDAISFNWTAWRSFRALIAQTQGRCEQVGSEQIGDSFSLQEEFSPLNDLLDELEVIFNAQGLRRRT